MQIIIGMSAIEQTQQICVVFKMLVDESYRCTRRFEAIGDLIGV